MYSKCRLIAEKKKEYYELNRDKLNEYKKEYIHKNNDNYICLLYIIKLIVKLNMINIVLVKNI